MLRLSRFALPLSVLFALLLPAGPAAAIDVCGNGICNTTTIPAENAANCPADCGAGPNDCPIDTCENGSCSQPPAGVDADADGVPDGLEHDLAHRFFPDTLLQWHGEDRSESYLFRFRSTPYTLRPFVGDSTLCDAAFECLEIRWGITFFYDHGDIQYVDAYEHLGDSEMYAALLRRSPFWQGPATDPEAWTVIRDFTSAHWGESWSDSSVVGIYGDCPEPCSIHTGNARVCNARSTCQAAGYCSGYSGCVGLATEAECLPRGCNWTPICSESFDWRCYRDSPLDANATIFSAESKHALYHSDDECDGGGFWNSDDCPNNEFNLRDSKEGLLQNVGNPSSHTGFDVTIQDPTGCGSYDVWSGDDFGGAAPYRRHFTTTLNWALD